jgi:hypothetical protein
MTFTSDELQMLDQILWEELRRADTMVIDYYEAVYDLREKIMQEVYA